MLTIVPKIAISALKLYHIFRHIFRLCLYVPFCTRCITRHFVMQILLESDSPTVDFKVNRVPSFPTNIIKLSSRDRNTRIHPNSYLSLSKHMCKCLCIRSIHDRNNDISDANCVNCVLQKGSPELGSTWCNQNSC